MDMLSRSTRLNCPLSISPQWIVVRAPLLSIPASSASSSRERMGTWSLSLRGAPGVKKFIETEFRFARD